MACPRALVAFAMIAALCSCKLSEAPASSLAIAMVDFCETKLAKDIVRIEPARIGSTVVYTIDKGACRKGKPKFALAEPGKDPVIILWNPSRTNLSAKDYERLKRAGITEESPYVQGVVDGKHVATQETRTQERVILKSAVGDQRAYPESAFAEKEAITLYRDLKDAGVPVLMVDATQDDAAITRQTEAFLERSGGDRLRVVPIGHGVEGDDGKHKMVASTEKIRVGQTRQGPFVSDYSSTPEVATTVDKINAIMAGSNLPGQCMVKSCYSGTIVDDGLSSKVEQLMTFSTPKTTAAVVPSTDPNYADGSIAMMRDYLTGKVGDKNGDGTQDLVDLRRHFSENGEQFKIAEPRVEVRSSIFTTQGQNPAFVAIEADRPQGTASGPSETYQGVPVLINGQAAMADIRITPTEVNELQQINVYERQGDGYQDVTPSYGPSYESQPQSDGHDIADMPMNTMGASAPDASSL